MTQHVLLDNVSHKDLRVRNLYVDNPTLQVNLARVFPSEITRLQAEYPLFFVRESENFELISLFGFTETENLYLYDGGWDAGVVPLTIERGPFLIGFQEQDIDGFPQKVPVVHVDIDHPCISSEEGEAVFLDHGGQSPYLERMSSVLMAIHEGNLQAKKLSEMLVGLELIESLELDVEFVDGSRQSLKGLFTVNEDRLRGLDGHALAALHEEGFLQHVYMQLASLPNLSGLIRRKNVRLV